MHQVFTKHWKKKEIDAPSFWHLLADGQLLMYVSDAASPSIRYLWLSHDPNFLKARVTIWETDILKLFNNFFLFEISIVDFLTWCHNNLFK